MTTYIPNPDDWRDVGVVNKKVTWLAVKPEAEVLLFEDKQHSNTLIFEKGTRIYMEQGKNGQELVYKPDCSLIRNKAASA